MSISQRQKKLRKFFNDNQPNLYYSGYLGLLSAVFLMWFVGKVYKTLSEHEGVERRPAVVALRGCLASGIGVALAYFIIEMISSLTGAESGIGPLEAILLNNLYGTSLVGLVGFSMAVFIEATSVVSLRTSMFRKWITWVSVVIS